jgi:ketol-acid reductoisomerase
MLALNQVLLENGEQPQMAAFLTLLRAKVVYISVFDCGFRSPGNAES